jgi:hypothetical protein
MFTTLAIDADTEWLMMDATIIRAINTPQAQKGAAADAGLRT